ncbi:N-acylmannosamine kinase [Lentibacillus sp. JNUCC-1]|uniref:ROK family protein n=1 Tax=Lentibacillus sp. JNUCC-1 TaxID=2654513 RepID=UPI0012E7FDA3|nr:N-acylmannosamine kinase [Lentibacillus sp. JNUCC-1]
MIVQSRIHRGFGNGAGEIGHMSIDIDGPSCNCGNYGCLETLSSGIAIKRRMQEEIRRGVESSLSSFEAEAAPITLKMIAQHAQEGDRLANDLLEEAARYLGLGVANVINLLAPDRVIFGGEVIDIYPQTIQTAEKIAKARTFSPQTKNIPFIKSSFGEQSGLIGAAAIIQQWVFDTPETTVMRV